MKNGILNSCDNFEIRAHGSESGSVWLYWFGKPLKHLTPDEFGALALLMATTDI